MNLGWGWCGVAQRSRGSAILWLEKTWREKYPMRYFAQNTDVTIPLAPLGDLRCRLSPTTSGYGAFRNARRSRHDFVFFFGKCSSTRVSTPRPIIPLSPCRVLLRICLPRFLLFFIVCAHPGPTFTYGHASSPPSDRGPPPGSPPFGRGPPPEGGPPSGEPLPEDGPPLERNQADLIQMDIIGSQGLGGLCSYFAVARSID